MMKSKVVKWYRMLHNVSQVDVLSLVQSIYVFIFESLKIRLDQLMNILRILLFLKHN